MLLVNGLLSDQNHREGNARDTQAKAHTTHSVSAAAPTHPKASMAQLTLLGVQTSNKKVSWQDYGAQ